VGGGGCSRRRRVGFTDGYPFKNTRRILINLDFSSLTKPSV